MSRRRLALTHAEAVHAKHKIEISGLFAKLRTVVEVGTRIMKTEEDMERETAEMLYANEPIALRLMARYFALREELGPSEAVIAKTLELLRKYYGFRGRDSPASGDPSLGELIRSAQFRELIEDVEKMLESRTEFRGDVMAAIFASLRHLGFKTHALVEAGARKALYELTLTKENGVLASRNFRAELHSLIGITPPASDQETSQADGSDCELSKVDAELQRMSGISAEFLQGIAAMRENYFDLKRTEKQCFLRRHPELLLDFFTLEEQLITLGVLMPYDLVADGNSPQACEVAAQQVALSAGIDGAVLKRLADAESPHRTGAAVEEMEEKRRNFAEESALLFLAEVMRMLSAPFPSAPAVDDLADPNAAHLFGPVTTQREKKEKFGLTDRQREAFFGASPSPSPAFYYGRAYRSLRVMFDKELTQRDPCEFSPLARAVFATCMRILTLDAGRFEEAFLSASDGKITSPEGLLAVAALTPSISVEVFRKILLCSSCNEHFTTLSLLLKSSSTDPSEKACVLYFLQAAGMVAAKQVPGLLEAVDSICTPSVIESAAFFSHPRPLDPAPAAVWLFIHQHSSLLCQRLGGRQRVGKLEAQLRLVMGKYDEHNRDPLRVFLRTTLRKEAGQFAWPEELRWRDEIPDHWLPDVFVLSSGQPLAFYLCPPGVSEKSVDSHVRRALMGATVEFRVLPVSTFMSDPNFFSSFDFTLESNPTRVRSLLAHFVAETAGCGSLSAEIEELKKRRGTSEARLLACFQRLLSNAPNDPLLMSQIASRLPALMDGSDESVNQLCQKLIEKSKLLPHKNSPVSLFSGVRFGKELFHREESLRELANPVLLEQSAYALFSSSPEAVGKLSPIDYQMLRGTLPGRYGCVERVLLPNPSGRPQHHFPNRRLFVDDKEMARLDSLVHCQRQPPGWHFSLLNVLYAFRLFSDFHRFFAELFALPVWERLASLSLGREPLPPHVPPSLSCEERLLVAGSSADYRKRLAPFKALEEELRYLKNLSECVLPELLANANGQEREKLVKDVETAKKDYLECLKRYKQKLSDHSTNYDTSQFKDFVTRVVMEEGESVVATVEQIAASHPARKLLLAAILAKKKTSHELSVSEKYIEGEIAKGKFISDLGLFSGGADFSVGSVFGEAEFAFFDRHFPQADLRNFSEESFSDLAFTLSWMLNGDVLEEFSLGLIIGTVGLFPPGCRPHHARLDLLEMERRAEFEARRLSDSDQEQLIRLLSINRRSLNSRNFPERPA